MKEKIIFSLLIILSAISATNGQNFTNQDHKTFIDPLSVQSLFLEQVDNNNEIIGCATGFVFEFKSKYYLITNWHVVTGRDPRTNQILDKKGRIPTSIQIWHNADTLGIWESRIELLYKENKPLWIEHPKGRNVDVIALPLTIIDDKIKIYPFDLKLAETDMIPMAGMPVSIIGFPFCMSGPGKMAIWKTGHIATEPDIDFNGEPFFVIGATTRQGMSGSPVVLRLTGGYNTKLGNSIMSTSGMRTKFLGIYSGQWTTIELGKVWFPKVILQILNK